MTDWQDQMVGARMAVDQEFTAQIQGSQFTRQEWGMIMTAVEFDIEDAADDDAATLVADTDDVHAIVPELETLREHQRAMGPGGGGGRAGGGILDSVTAALGLGRGGDDATDPETVDAARQLVETYAVELQTHLEETGRWAEIRAAYREG